MLNLATKFRPEPAAFELAFRAGFRCAEFFLNRELLEDSQQIAELASGYRMKYALHFPNKPNLEEQHLRHCVQLYRDVGATAMVMHPPMHGRFAAALRKIDPSLVLAVETMRVPREEIVAWVGQQQQVTLDVEHIWSFTLPGEPISVFFELLDRILNVHANCVKHVHMPGYLPGQGEHRPMYTSREFCLGVFEILSRHRYDGLVVSEVDMQFQNPFDLRMDVLLYEGWLARQTGSASPTSQAGSEQRPHADITSAHGASAHGASAHVTKGNS